MSVLLVTGASRGIGAGIARLAAERGWHVGINFAVDEASAQDVAAYVREQGVKACVVQADVSKPDEVEAMFSATEKALGPIAGLVNSAGIATGVGRIESLDVAETRKMLDVNVFGLYLCCRCAVKRMAKRHGGTGGTIVNISSAAARTGAPGAFVDYAGAKGAVDTMTVGLAKEQADQGIHVYAVRPGLINTELVRAAAEKNPAWVDGIIAAVPMGRIGEIREVSNAVLWLLSQEAHYATGTIIDISGGRVTQ